jgi:hypothetical protein
VPGFDIRPVEMALPPCPRASCRSSAAGREQAGGARQVFRPIEAFRWTQRWDATNSALRQIAFDRRQSEHILGSETQGQRVDQLTDIDLRAIFGHVPADRLFFGERFYPGCRERGQLDAKARIDYERFPDGYTCHFVRPQWKLPRRAEAKAS